jgi:ABC-type dipeptide/oligopeptide/nickel transport system permease component
MIDSVGKLFESYVDKALYQVIVITRYRYPWTLCVAACNIVLSIVVAISLLPLLELESMVER